MKGKRDIYLLGKTTDTYAYALNNKSQVVGKAFVNGQYSAFFWDEGAGAFDLNYRLAEPTDWHLLGASGINDRGEIVGYATKGGVMRACLLRPKGGALPAIIDLLLNNIK